MNNQLMHLSSLLSAASKRYGSSYMRCNFFSTVSVKRQEGLKTEKAQSSEIHAVENTSELQYAKSAPLVTLHKRLGLPESFKLSLLSTCLTCRSFDKKSTSNQGLNIFGKNLLTYYVSEYLLCKYPRLPSVILNTAIDSYISSDSLYQVGKYSWGIEIDDTPELKKYLNEEPKEYSFGKLRFVPLKEHVEHGVTQITRNPGELDPTQAYALAVRSIIAGIYTSTESESEAKQFIYDHILARKLDLSKMFEFEQPTRELSKLCKRENLQQPVARLLAENGRLTKNPVFVVGVFSGDEKLGESYGSSLKEAKIRASVNALKNWYLYRPLNVTVPSDESFKPGIIDHGIVIV